MEGVRRVSFHASLLSTPLVSMAVLELFLIPPSGSKTLNFEKKTHQQTCWSLSG
ncbi:hypothetical protein E2C01_063648 [Portunus trituberculatus]|uniref:Uncharacterized protein n=1 Tax=Portunus trituberculatus TaxID=210409 RepID=A0A5B7HGX5_PORTR|nr:hypothetical protein [Portunus trituberculatus]